MSTSTDAILFFGVLLDEDQELPWEDSDDEFGGWFIRNETAWKPAKECYDENGEHLPGVTEEDVTQYWAEFRDYEPKHFEIVYHCSYEYPMFGLALKDCTLRAYRGYPKVVNFGEIISAEKALALPDDRQVLDDFIKKHGLKVSEYGWYLVSMWG